MFQATNYFIFRTHHHAIIIIVIIIIIDRLYIHRKGLQSGRPQAISIPYL
jgi:hypothetical protein